MHFLSFLYLFFLYILHYIILFLPLIFLLYNKFYFAYCYFDNHFIKTFLFFLCQNHTKRSFFIQNIRFSRQITLFLVYQKDNKIKSILVIKSKISACIYIMYTYLYVLLFLPYISVFLL